MTDSSLQRLARRRVQELCLAALKMRVRVEVIGASPAGIRKLNRKYLRRNRLTDVLSFPTSRAFQQRGFLGEIVVCWSVLRAQAWERDIPDDLELQILLIHGVLHLLGYDHEKSALEARKMARKENALLKKTWKRKWGTRAHEGLLTRNHLRGRTL